MPHLAVAQGDGFHDARGPVDVVLLDLPRRGQWAATPSAHHRRVAAPHRLVEGHGGRSPGPGGGACQFLSGSPRAVRESVLGWGGVNLPPPQGSQDSCSAVV